MNSTLLAILKTILAILPLLVLCLLSGKVNLRKPRRSRQFLMPAIALIYVIVAMILAHRIDSWLLTLMHQIAAWGRSIFYSGMVPGQLRDFLTPAVAWIMAKIRSLDINYWIFYITNYAIMIAFLIVKRIIITILSAVFKKRGSFHDAVSGRFYDYFADKGVWVVKERFADARTLLRVAYYTVVGVSAALMLVSARLYQAELLADIFYPVFACILIGEVFFYLDGLTKHEYIRQVLGEDDDAFRVVNYSLLRKYLRNLFEDKLLAENTLVNNALTYTVTNDEIIGEYEDSEDRKLAAFGKFYRRLNDSGFELDHNYVNSSLELLQGKSILFNNPFYRDLIPYAFYPMNRVLLSHAKVLVVLGRHSIEGDITQWLADGVESVTNLPFLWDVSVLSEEPGEKEPDIGIITRSDVINAKLHEANSEFLKKVSFVFIIEPSKLISTAQIGLNLIVKQCRGASERGLTYCLCDKNCDGLVDAMSHILMTGLTEVTATNKHLGTSSYMCWEADREYLHHRMFPNVSRYLGLGTELSFAALKNQVSKTQWYGGEAFPVTDINWIDKQYYYDLMKYAALPTSQEAIDKFFMTSANFWSAPVTKNNYFTVEDESFNMFEILRNFSTRSTEQGFINVISSEYLLKDYMADNDSIFEADAKAVPYLAADYARTNRNVVLRLMLLMSMGPVSCDVIEKEFSLIGIPPRNLKKRLWYEIYKCVTGAEQIAALPENISEAEEKVSKLSVTLPGGTEEFRISMLRVFDKYNYELGRAETVFSIDDESFISSFVSSLKSASYVAEDEKGEKYYLGAELGGQIYQRILPGQFFTYDGKYYEMLYLTADNQVLVRRASDHIDGRVFYRQLREYTLHALLPSSTVGAIRDISGIKVSREYADISVETPGYYRMDRYNDFAGAKKVLYDSTGSRVPRRDYFNKELLKINLPAGEQFTPQVRYTITLLINEVFRTLFAENQAFICALTDTSHITDEECQPLTYSVVCDGIETDRDSIYIIEDSQLDLGLLITVERSLDRIFRIIEDYLAWNRRSVALSLNPPKRREPAPINHDEDEEQPEQKKENLFKRIAKKIKGFFSKLFKRKKKDAPGNEQPEHEQPVPENPPVDEKPTEEIPVEELPVEETPADDAPTGETPADEQPAQEIPDEEPPADETPSVEAPADEPVEDDSASRTSTDAVPPEEPANDIYGDELTEVENKRQKRGSIEFRRLPYHERYYLLYGYTGEPDVIDTVAALDYLRSLGFDKNNQLKEARRGKHVAQMVEATFKPNKKNSRYCDFCGNEIFGVEYETLSDGRDRCVNCGRTAVKTEEEFKKLFEDVKRNMEAFFGIKLNCSIRVEMVNARTLHRLIGKAFVPTTKVNNRVLGFAMNDRHGDYKLVIENGSPRMMSMLTMAHELTHIWQYLNWNEKAIIAKYGKDLNNEIYEGMAKWVEVQYAYLINEPGVAKREEIITAHRDDCYGRGYIRYKANYPIVTGTVVGGCTPFMDPDNPLDPAYCGSDVAVMLPPDNGGLGYDDEDDIDLIPADDFDDDIPTPGDELPEGTNTRTGEAQLYGRDTLDDRSKQLYDCIRTAVELVNPEINTLPGDFTIDELKLILPVVRADYPEAFWFRGTYRYTYDVSTNILKSISLSYCLTSSEVERMKAEIEKNVPDFIRGIDSSASDFDAAVTIYDNLIKLIDYDSIALDSQGDDGVPDDKPDNIRSVYGALAERKAVCAGYARAFQYLCNRIGLSCEYVTGESKGEAHAWNLISLEGDWYYVDVTWDDHSNTLASKNTSDEISHNYFGVTSAELFNDHKPDSTVNLPNCTARQCNYFIRKGMYVEEYNFEQIRRLFQKQLEDGSEVAFKCSDESYAKVKRELIDNNDVSRIISFLNLNPKVRLSSSYSYCARDVVKVITFYFKKV